MYSIMEVSVGCIFMLGRMVGSVRDIMVSVKVGFLKTDICILYSVLFVEFIVLLIHSLWQSVG